MLKPKQKIAPSISSAFAFRTINFAPDSLFALHLCMFVISWSHRANIYVSMLHVSSMVGWSTPDFIEVTTPMGH